jgi:hypothetical protein
MPDKLETATRGAIGLAKALDLDSSAAARYTALAMQGEFTILQRYVPALRAATDAAEKERIVMALMTRGYRQAQAEVETLSGQKKQLSNLIGDLMEDIGAGLAPTVGRMVRGLRDFIRRTRDSGRETDTFAGKLNNLDVVVKTRVIPILKAFAIAAVNIFARIGARVEILGKALGKAFLMAEVVKAERQLGVVAGNLAKEQEEAARQMDEFGHVMGSVRIRIDQISKKEARLRMQLGDLRNALDATGKLWEFGLGGLFDPKTGEDAIAGLEEKINRLFGTLERGPDAQEEFYRGIMGQIEAIEMQQALRKGAQARARREEEEAFYKDIMGQIADIEEAQLARRRARERIREPRATTRVETAEQMFRRIQTAAAAQTKPEVEIAKKTEKNTRETATAVKALAKTQVVAKFGK